MSNISDKEIMNLHEECLLKYLINPLELFYTTELLRINNELLEKEGVNIKEFANKNQVNYTVI